MIRITNQIVAEIVKMNLKKNKSTAETIYIQSQISQVRVPVEKIHLIGIHNRRIYRPR